MADKIPRLVAGSLSLTLSRHIGIDSKEEEEHSEDFHIMEDGSPKIYKRWYKKVLYLNFENVTESVRSVLLTMRRESNTVDYYRDQDDSTPYGTFVWVGNFTLTESPIYLGGGFGYYSGTLELREV